ncbi:MAG: glycosyltransferase family 39 protein [Thiohalocapsa sp.]
MQYRASPSSPSASQDGRDWAVATAVLLAIIAAGTASRLIGLDHLPIWHDEVFTLVRVFGYPGDAWNTLFSGQLLTPEQVLRFQQPDTGFGWAATFSALAEHPEHAPLYYLLGRLTTLLPIDPVTALRGTSAAFGVLLPLAAFWLMRTLFGRGPGAWVAAAIIAVSPLHLLYAQEARQYALWTLLVLAASAALLRALRMNRAGDWWLYGGFLTLGLYSHLLFALVLPVHAAYGWLTGSAASGRLLRPTGLPIRRWLIAVGIASTLFLPWIIVLLSGLDNAANHTEWMERAIGAQRNLLSWARHLSRAFLDLSPAQEPPPASLVLLLPLTIAVGYYLLKAPRPQRWLLVLLTLVYLGIVLGPDLLFGGSRSLHVRYGLPALLGIQLMVAWSIGAALQQGRRARAVGVLALALLLPFGLWSQWRIQQAETWWSKQFSADNIAIARMINAFERPLVAVSPSGVAEGELISLAYHLDGHVRIWSQHGAGAEVELPTGFDAIIMLLPSQELRDAIGADHGIEPIGDSWQWLLARPKPEPATAHGLGESNGAPTP